MVHLTEADFRTIYKNARKLKENENESNGLFPIADASKSYIFCEDSFAFWECTLQGILEAIADNEDISAEDYDRPIKGYGALFYYDEDEKEVDENSEKIALAYRREDDCIILCAYNEPHAKSLTKGLAQGDLKGRDFNVPTGISKTLLYEYFFPEVNSDKKFSLPHAEWDARENAIRFSLIF